MKTQTLSNTLEQAKRFNLKKTAFLMIVLTAFTLGCDDDDDPEPNPPVKDVISSETAAQQSIDGIMLSGDDRIAQYAFTTYTSAWGLQEMTTEEFIIPQRGSGDENSENITVVDWYDNGRYEAIQEFRWTAESDMVNRTWTDLVTGSSASHRIVEDLKNSPGLSKQPLYLAQARAFRAFFLMNLLDLFGKNGISIFMEINPSVTNTTEAAAFIISEFELAIPDLDDFSSSNKFSKQTVQGFLAKAYLNRGVYNNHEAASFSFADTDMDKVVELTTAVINSGKFSLTLGDDYFGIFDLDNDTHSEHIFAIDQDATNKGTNDLATVGLPRNFRAIPNVRSINGSCATPEFVASWTGNTNDKRYHKDVLANEKTMVPFPNFSADEYIKYDRGVLQGPQYGPSLTLDPENADVSTFNTDENGKLIIDKMVNFRDNNMVNLEFHSTGVRNTMTQEEGVRINKYEFDHRDENRKTSSLNIPVLRFAEIYLLRAEANIRKSGADANNDLRTIRTNRGSSITATDLNGVLLERTHELYLEGVRRSDLIRFGEFDKDRALKGGASDPSRRIFPKPNI